MLWIFDTIDPPEERRPRGPIFPVIFSSSTTTLHEMKTQPIESALVIGGCGSLGHGIVKRLLEIQPPIPISVFDLNTKPNRFPGVQYYEVDITDRNKVDLELSNVKPQVIFHTASPPAGLLDLEFYMKVNVEGTRNLLESAKTQNVKAFVHTSSASVIHDAHTNLILADETTPLVYLPAQREIYSHSKAVADRLVLDSNSRSTRTGCIRPSGMFCEGDPTPAAFVANAAQGKLRYNIGGGENLFDFTYQVNAIHAHILLAEALLTRGDEVGGEAFLVTNDEPMPFWEFGRLLGDAAGYPTDRERVRSLPLWVGLVVAAVAEWVVWVVSAGRRNSRLNRVAIRYSALTRTYSVEKAKRVLGYRPLVGLREGIERSGRSFGRGEKGV
ncbi:NAD(P)-binding Rossmann-fold containing protein [Glarea lozoyensis ATCC 20868]|uniref:NAD(P)-binding Rossmann-fold containing protein n=1 Tax=Glarea lozoyensis (strain ATCC 20868 / MF5171) TaxID=1116229 RepID=S3CZC8_GLAL2|nr:NAD(P)-binding Rossmann-fold containing protein [Glarea lozoyensis ATCC 20868]EPE25191.1 NAD(P)-binding Rossmann-fold containing protein [Glarea lozoyensis ATCC 20868]